MAQDGPVVLSPPRKSRRVMGFEGNAHHLGKVGEQVWDGKLMGEPSNQSGEMPMSVDLGAIFGSRPAPRPTLNR